MGEGEKRSGDPGLRARLGGEPVVPRSRQGCGQSAHPYWRFVPVGVEAVERVRAMTRGQLAAKVADVQASRLLARAGAYPARGSQKREGFLRGQKLLIGSGGRRLVGHGWRWPARAPSLALNTAPAPAPTLTCPLSPLRRGVRRSSLAD